MTWIGNLVGALCSSRCSTVGGGGGLLCVARQLVMKVAAAKMNASAPSLVRARGAVQLARLPRDVDGGARQFRLPPSARHLLVPLRVHRLRVRAQRREHDGARSGTRRQSPGDGVAMPEPRGTWAGSRSAMSSAARSSSAAPTGSRAATPSRSRWRRDRSSARAAPTSLRARQRLRSVRAQSFTYAACAMPIEFTDEQKRYLDGLGARRGRSARGQPRPRRRPPGPSGIHRAAQERAIAAGQARSVKEEEAKRDTTSVSTSGT